MASGRHSWQKQHISHCVIIFTEYHTADKTTEWCDHEKAEDILVVYSPHGQRMTSTAVSWTVHSPLAWDSLFQLHGELQQTWWRESSVTTSNNYFNYDKYFQHTFKKATDRAAYLTKYFSVMVMWVEVSGWQMGRDGGGTLPLYYIYTKEQNLYQWSKDTFVTLSPIYSWSIWQNWKEGVGPLLQEAGWGIFVC